MNASSALLRKIGFCLIALPLFIVVCALCVMNAGPISFILWPAGLPLDLPLFVVILGAFAAGFLAGGALTWLDKR